MKTRTTILWRTENQLKQLRKPKVGSLGKKKKINKIDRSLADWPGNKKERRLKLSKPGMKAETSQPTLQKQK